MDYPERFERPPGLDNPITGGMGSISPHPLESPALLALADETLARPLIRLMAEQGTLRPGVLYPGCFASFDGNFQPTAIRVCEINIRPGEPEFQPVVKRLRNLGALVTAMADGTLDKVAPEVRSDQVSLCMALVTGPGGPKQQKGYPWSLTKGEVVEMDFDYFDKKKLTVIPSAMDYADGRVQVRRLPGGVSPGQRHRQGRAHHGPGRRAPAPEAAQRLRQRQDPGDPPGGRPGQPPGPAPGHRGALSEGRSAEKQGLGIRGQGPVGAVSATALPLIPGLDSTVTWEEV